MNTKISLHELALAIASRLNLPESEADIFVNAFFDLIADKVVEDKAVKIKGLGTFKLIEVSDRESVNVNTGERIVIPGHPKVSFTPDTTLRDQVNKPFADFQTVMLNEGTSIDEMERFDETPIDDFVKIQEETVEEETAPEVVAPIKTEPETEEKSHFIEEPVPATVPQTAPVQQANAPQVNVVHKGYSPWFTLVYILLTLLLMAFSYYAGYNHLLTPQETSAKAEKEIEAETKVPQPVDSVALRRKETLRQANQYPQVPGGTHLIVGTRKVHVMRVGDSLSKIAVSEYGHKDFAQYIIVYNQFPNPDVISVGCEVKLPELIENNSQGK